MNPRKTILNGQEYELVTAEVVDVDFSGKDKEKLYTIQCKLLGSFGSQTAQNTIQARALDANLKNIPISGEVVMLLKGPTAYNSYVGTSQEYYYTNPVSIQSSIHHNGLPGVSEILKSDNPNNSEKRQNAQDGIVKNTSKKNTSQTTIDPVFPERADVFPLQPYSGDIILPSRPHWSKGLSDPGNPILIISNGINSINKKYNEFTQENPDTDDSSIWMTSGQEVKFTPASTYTPSITDKSVDLYKKNKFSGNQVIISSDRLIFNSKQQEFIVFSKEGIGFSAEKSISIDGKQVVEIESKRINLGLNAKSPVLLGDRTMDWLNDLCSILSSFLTSVTKLTVPTSFGPSGFPINTPSFVELKTRTKTLQQKIEKLQSQLAFVNEFTNGPTEDAKANEEKREAVQESRNEGNLEQRQSSDPNETSLSDRQIQTSNEWQGNALWDPTKSEVYGNRDKNSVTWFYDKEWYNHVQDMETDDGLSDGQTPFDSEFMGKITSKNTNDTGSLQDDIFLKRSDT
jgi:hypothetical protein